MGCFLKTCSLLLLLCLSCKSEQQPHLQFNRPHEIDLVGDSGAEFDFKNKIIQYRQGIQLTTNNGEHLTASRADIFLNKKKVSLSGHVSIYQGPILHRGDRAVYDYESGELNTKGFKMALAPFMIQTDNFELKKQPREHFEGTNAAITTHDSWKPNFWLKASSIKIYPEEKVVLKNLRVLAGSTPVFWLPYLSQPLHPDLGYHFLPGTKSHWGAFWLNRYGMMLGGTKNNSTGKMENQWLLSQWFFDLYSKRGLGLGLHLYDTRLKDNPNLGWLKLYSLYDQDPSYSRTGLNRSIDDPKRYSLEWKYRWNFKNTFKNSSSQFDVDFTKLSDKYFLEDYNDSQYSSEPFPDQRLGFKTFSESSQWGAWGRFRINRFHDTDTRLPELYYDWVRRPIDFLGVLHEGTASLGFYHEHLSDFKTRELNLELLSPTTSAIRQSSIRKSLERREYARLHLYQEVSRPFQLHDAINITPRIGGGLLNYWNADEDNTSHKNYYWYLGLDASIKWLKFYDEIQIDSLGIDSLLHTVQPYFQMSSVQSSPLESDGLIIDRLTATEQPRPFDVGRFSAIDEIRNWHILRLGIHNYLFTKQNKETHRWLTLDSYFDVFFNDPEQTRQFSNFNNNLVWHPLPRIKLNLKTQIPIDDNGFNLVSTNLQIQAHKNFNLNLGQRLIDDHSRIPDSNRIDIKSYLRLNHKWGLATHHQWEFDDNVIERQEYAVYHNLESWTVSLNLFQRNHRINREYGIFLNFFLRAMPSIRIPLILNKKEPTMNN